MTRRFASTSNAVSSDLAIDTAPNFDFDTLRKLAECRFSALHY